MESVENFYLQKGLFIMRSKIIGVSYNHKEDANTKEVREGIQLRYSFPVKGVIGADVRSDYIGDKDVLEVFRPFINGHLDESMA